MINENYASSIQPRGLTPVLVVSVIAPLLGGCSLVQLKKVVQLEQRRSPNRHVADNMKRAGSESGAPIISDSTTLRRPGRSYFSFAPLPPSSAFLPLLPSICAGGSWRQFLSLASQVCWWIR